MEDTIQHKCPCCGASLEFDVLSQTVKCPYCDSEFDPKALAANDGNLEEIKDEVELADDGGSEWGLNELEYISEYTCKSCGGDLYTDSNTAATLCPYCGSAVMLKGRLSGVLKPDKVIPFQQTKQQAVDKLEAFCGGKRFVPKKFLMNNRLEEIKGLYVPFWVYDAELEADVVYDCMSERTWTVGNTEYTERKYYKVRRAGDIAFDHVPADGSSNMPDELMESIEPYDYDKAEEFTTTYLSGYVADKYDVDQEQVRPRVRKRMSEGAAEAFKSTVRGYDTVNVTGSEISAKNSSVSYVLYPVWLLNTDWNGKKFVFAMNGQTGKMVGNLPMDKMKLYSVSALLFFIMAGLFGIGGYLLDGMFNPGALGVGVFVGMMAAAMFYSHFSLKLRTVHFQHGAKDYYREGSMNLHVKTDEFLYKRTETRHIDRD